MQTRLLGLLFLTIFASGCVSYAKSTGYVPADKEGGEGYFIKPDAESLHAIYQGNKDTPTTSAYGYALASGIEHCLAQGSLPNFRGTRNTSVTSSYDIVRTVAYPIYIKQQLVGYDNQTSTQPVTETKPSFDAEFTCRKSPKAFRDVLEMKPMEVALVNVFTRDFKGGLSITEMDTDQRHSSFSVGDVLISINAHRVETLAQRDQALDVLSMSDSVTMVPTQVIRAGKITNIQAEIIDLTSVMADATVKISKMVCKGLPTEELTHKLGDTTPLPSPAMCKAVAARAVKAEQSAN